MKDWKEYFNEAAMAINEGDNERSLEYANKCIEAGCDNIDIYSIRGMANHCLGHHQACIDDLTIYLLEIDKDYELLLNRGVSYGAIGDDDKAMEDYNSCLKYAPNYGICFLNRGYIFYKRGNYPQAISDFINAEKYGVATEDMFWRRAVAFFNSHDNENAKKDLAKAIASGAERAQSFALLGRIYYEEGDFENAVQTLSRAIYLDDTDTETYYHRMASYSKLNKNKEAEIDGNRLLAMRPSFFVVGTEAIKFPVVKVIINDAGELAFLIDTGEGIIEHIAKL